MSRHVRDLEESLDVRLFVRHARGVRLTERGQELVAVAEQVERAMDGFRRVAVGARERVAGTVRLAASEIVGAEVLAPHLGALRTAHPGIELELALANTASDLSRGEADLAVRLYRPTELGLVAVLIGAVEIGLFASRSYLDRRGAPSSVAGLLEHELIGFDSRGPMARVFEGFDPRMTSDRFSVRTDSLTVHLAAARAGCGIASLQVPIAARYPELVRVGLPAATMALPFWLTAHGDVRGARHVAAVWTWCERVLRDYVASPDVFDRQ